MDMQIYEGLFSAGRPSWAWRRRSRLTAVVTAYSHRDLSGSTVDLDVIIEVEVEEEVVSDGY